MKTTLEKLWSGELAPWSEPEEKDREAAHYAKMIEQHIEELISRLDEEETIILKKYEQTHCDYLFLAREDAFQKGFSLGVKLISEAFFIK